MAIMNVDELLKKSKAPQPTEKALAAARKRERADVGTQYDEDLIPIINWNAPTGGDAMLGHGVIPSFKSAGVMGALVGGAQKLVAPSKKLLSGAMDVQGMADTGGTIAGSALDLSNLQRPSDYMKTLGKMQGAPQPVPSLPMPQLKLSSTRMAREGYGSMDRVLRFLNKQDPFVSKGQVDRMVGESRKRLKYTPEEILEARKNAPQVLNDSGWYPFTEIGQQGMHAYGNLPHVRASESFTQVPGLHRDTAELLDSSRGAGHGIRPGRMLGHAMLGHTAAVERGLRDRVSRKATGRMEDLLQRVAGPGSLVRDPMFRDSAAWDGHIGESVRRETAQVQAKNRRTRGDTAGRASNRSGAIRADTVKADLTHRIRGQMDHARATMPKNASTRMAREGYGAADRALRYVNNLGGFVSPKLVGTQVKQMVDGGIPREEVSAHIGDLVQMINDQSSAVTNTGLAPAARRGVASMLTGALPADIEAAKAMSGVMALAKERRVQNKVNDKASRRVQDWVRQYAGPGGMLGKGVGVEDWESGHIGNAARTHLTQIQAKNRRSATDASERLRTRARDLNFPSDMNQGASQEMFDRIQAHQNIRRSANSRWNGYIPGME